MAVGKVITNVLDVGQGQCTFVEVYDTKNKLINTLLFDCGSDKESPNTDANLDYIAAKVCEMTPPTIDLVVLSHSDKDHISLIKTLIDKINDPTFEISDVWYAGRAANYKKHGDSVLDLLRHFALNVSTTHFNFSEFDPVTGNYTTRVWASDDGTVMSHIIMSNVIDDTPGSHVKAAFGTTAEEKNRVSIICDLVHASDRFVICGDATNRTMAWVNHVFTGRYLLGVQMLTLPHHGSRATGLNVSSGKDANQAAIDVVDGFVGVMRARTVTISSFEKHSHPSTEFINLFAPYLTTTAVISDENLQKASKSHYIVNFVDIQLDYDATFEVGKTYHTLTTTSNVFNTYYFDSTYTLADMFSYVYGSGQTVVGKPAKQIGTPAINEHACWVYTTYPKKLGNMYGCAELDATGNTAFTNVGNLPDPNTALMAEPPALSPPPIPPVLSVSMPPVRSPARLMSGPALRRMARFR